MGGGRARQWAAVGAVAFGCGLAWAPQAPAAALGYNEAWNHERTTSAAAVGGAEWARLPIYWRDVQRARRFVWDRPAWGTLSGTDAAVAAIRGAGMRLAVILIGPPRWACATEPILDGSCALDVGFREQWLRYVREVVARYRPNAVEVWNEPWLPRFGGLSPGRYAALFNATSRAARQVSPRVKVLMALHVEPGDPWNAEALPRVKGHYIAAPHIYASDPAVEDQQEIRDKWAVASAAAGARPIWVTEMGFTSWYSEADQAQHLGAAFCFLAAHSPVVFVYRLVDGESAADRFGTLRSDYSPKPAYEMLRNLAAGGCVARPA